MIVDAMNLEDDARWAPTLDERLDDLDWFIGKMREKYGMSIPSYDDIWTDADEDAYQARLEEQRRVAARQAQFERMRRVAPKGTVFSKKLMKAKRRVG